MACVSLVGAVGWQFFEENAWVSAGAGFLMLIAALLAVVLFSQSRPVAERRLALEVGLDGLRLGVIEIPFGSLADVRLLERPDPSRAHIQLLREDGETIVVSVVGDGWGILRVIEERRGLYERLTAPRPRAKPDGYRGVRVADESPDLVEALREEVGGALGEETLAASLLFLNDVSV